MTEPEEAAEKVKRTAAGVASALERTAEVVAGDVSGVGEEAAGEVKETAVYAAHDLERVAEKVALRLGEEIGAALVAAAQQVEVAIEMVNTESADRKEALGKERADRRKGLLWVAAPTVLGLIAALFAVGGYLSVRHEADLREADTERSAGAREANVKRELRANCELSNQTNAGVLTLLNRLLDLGQKRDSVLPPEQLPAVVAARAESRALGLSILPQVKC